MASNPDQEEAQVQAMQAQIQAEEEESGSSAPTKAEEAQVIRRFGPQFIPKLRGQKVTIRLTSGQPVTGTLTGYNAFELLVMTAKGPLICFKGAISTIELANAPRSQDIKISK